MMHRSRGVPDTWEVLCSIEDMTLKRMRMERTQVAGGLTSDGNEALVVSMKGSATVSLEPSGVKFQIGDKDLCYVPKEESLAISRNDGPAEIILATAPAASRFKPFLKRFSETTPIQSGKAPFFRRVYNMVTDKDQVNRFLGGFVEGDSGNWTSFPPHRHDGKPEVYVYYGMGERFGVQMVLSEEGDQSFVVRDGDAVLFEKGYHPNAAAPGTGMNFLWIISAPPDKRDLSVSFHPAFKDMQSGPTHLKVD